jgi:ABC-type nitrate/sulfonate/bicarbonate transport system substrate-binding protein
MRNRTRLFASIGIPLLLVVIVGGIYFWQNRSQTQGQSSLTPMSLALDWTPNTNHTGIYVALANGWYRDEGIKLNLLPYSSNVTPDVLVSNGKADVGISSTEGVVADAGAGQPVVSIAAILQHNTSSLAVLASSNIHSPKDLDGKTYGAFGAPYENAVISQIIQHDGGKGTFKSVTISIDPLQALQSHQVDFVWIFDGAEGIQAKHQGIQLRTFPIIKNGIPDYSTPNIITSAATIKQKAALLQKFMAATARGYEYARQNPEQAAKDLISQTPKGTFPDESYVMDSQQYLSPRYADPGSKWGLQSAASWHNYPQLLMDKNGVTDAAGKPVHTLNFDTLYTNQFLSS